MTEQEQQQRGIAASQLLANELLQEAFATIEARIVERLALPDIKPDEVMRQQALLAAHRTIKRYILQVAQTGAIANLEEIQRNSWIDKIRAIVPNRN